MYTIELLKNHPNTIPALTRMWHDLLGRLWAPDVSLQRVEANFQNHLNDGSLPLTFIALDGNEPIGMCSLRENDGIRPDLKPWLGSLIVSQHYQKQGVAKMLMDTVKQKAKEMGFAELFLFAFDPTIPRYYQQQGWFEIGNDQFRNHKVTVMKISL